VKYKILLNAGDPGQPPWRVITPDGKSQYFNEITFETKVYTFSESTGSASPCNRGWLVCECVGELIADNNARTAVFR